MWFFGRDNGYSRTTDGAFFPGLRLDAQCLYRHRRLGDCGNAGNQTSRFRRRAGVETGADRSGIHPPPFHDWGTVIGRRLLERIPERVFAVLVEGMLVVAGLHFLIYG